MQSHTLKKTSKKTTTDNNLYFDQYYRNVASDDIGVRSEEDRQGAAQSHLKIAQKRIKGTPVIHVYNPDAVRDGWQSSCTVIDIVTDDMPFLVDSVRMELNRQGYTVSIIIHPLYRVERDATGRLINITDNGELEGNQIRESYMHAEIERQTDTASLNELEKGLGQTLMDVRKSVEDWRKMRDSLKSLIAELDNKAIPVAKSELEETKAFLQWLDANNYTFLGCRDYKLVTKNGKQVLAVIEGTGSGILREDGDGVSSRKFSVFSREVSKQNIDKELLIVTKANTRSTVHRPAYLDYFSVRRFDKKGEVIGERRFVGLYTSAAYRKNPRDIPYIRGKISKVFTLSKLDPVSHLGKALNHVLETYPRDELFQISEKDLLQTSQGIIQLGESQRIKLFVRQDRFARFVSCLVYVPKERFDTELRRRISDILYKGFNGIDLEFNVTVSDDALARVEFIIRTNPESPSQYDVAAIEKQIIETARHWVDNLKSALVAKLGEVEGYRQYSLYQKAFPAGYKEDFSAEKAVDDINLINSLSAGKNLAMNVYASGLDDPTTFNFKLYKSGNAIAPSDSFHILENMGVKITEEKPYAIKAGEAVTWVHNYSLIHASHNNVKIDEIKTVFEDAYAQAWNGTIENDGFNRLVLSAQLAWREVVIIRAYCKYLLQTKQSFSQSYMEETLASYPTIVRYLIELFTIRFKPEYSGDRIKAAATLEKKIEEALDAVSSLDQDRILRNFLDIIRATLRTNYYQTVINSETGKVEYHAYVSFKYNPSLVPDLPEPRPMFEIFVYSPRVEGVHLRWGKVARGGLRWSDRREDFRTEVLGLVKAQQVKNSVIVPVGAKGGFVMKRPPVGADRDTLMKEVVYCYTSFVSGLLDITDNIKNGKLIRPLNAVRHDEDDPYLVVAADKGTATFSDIANGIAAKYDFWLGDAFASGGSNGYDHKKMGITARGAWESIKLIFRDMGKNIQTEDFTVVGIGDMAGDVFGNGMLLSKHIRLLAAFNHMHIFLDPTPNVETSFAERQRLFNLPRSSWEDYDSKLISKGGGIFLRSAKSISLSPEIRQALDIKVLTLSPNALINAILKAPVDLIWNGGIGTYVKASTEQHSDVGDRANDVLRVDGKELRCKCVGEGGNLGLTQRGRIEFARNGGRVDTDFIHNAGGVDCSDHEVNIKILLNMLIQSNTITEKQRIKLLLDMTDEVAQSVLYSNYWQGQAIAQIESRAPQLLDEHANFMRNLESEGKLRRKLEALPSDDELVERKSVGAGLTRPEIAVLVSYSKIVMFPALTDSDLWEDEYFSRKLLNYFPSQLRKSYTKQMYQHQLRREILATSLVNRMVNRMGATFVYRLQTETGASVADVARAYTIAWEVFGLRQFWSDVAKLDNKVAGGMQTQMLLEGADLVYRSSKWLLQHRRRSLLIETTVAEYIKGADALSNILPKMFEKTQDVNLKARVQHYIDGGVPRQLALHVVAMDAYYSTFDIVDVAKKQKRDVKSVTELYFTISNYLDIYWLRTRAGHLVIDNQWQARARVAIIDDLYGLLRDLTREVLNTAPDEKSTTTQTLDAWRTEANTAIQRYRHVIDEFKLSEHLDIAMLSVALREIQNIVQVSSVR